MGKYRVLLSILLLSFVIGSHAQIVEDGWLQSASLSCGGSVSVDLNREFETALFRLLQPAKADVDGEYLKLKTEYLLKSELLNTKNQAYTNHIHCMSMLIGTFPQKAELRSPVAISPLKEVGRGTQDFTVYTGETVTLKESTIVLAVDRVYMHDYHPTVSFTWSSLINDRGGSQWHSLKKLAHSLKKTEPCFHKSRFV